MRFYIVGVPGIEFAVEEGVEQNFGFGAGHVGTLPLFLGNPCFAEHGPRTR